MAKVASGLSDSVGGNVWVKGKEACFACEIVVEAFSLNQARSLIFLGGVFLWMRYFGESALLGGQSDYHRTKQNLGYSWLRFELDWR